MNRGLESWIIINYCGQRIGQFSGADLKNSLLNVLVSQVAPLLFAPVIFIYISFGYRNFYVWLVLMVLVVWFTRICLSNMLKKHLAINRLEMKYKTISMKRKKLNFAISISLTGAAIVIFGYSLFLLKWLK